MLSLLLRVCLFVVSAFAARATFVVRFLSHSNRLHFLFSVFTVRMYIPIPYHHKPQEVVKIFLKHQKIYLLSDPESRIQNPESRIQNPDLIIDDRRSTIDDRRSTSFHHHHNTPQSTIHNPQSCFVHPFFSAAHDDESTDIHHLRAFPQHFLCRCFRFDKGTRRIYELIFFCTKRR